MATKRTRVHNDHYYSYCLTEIYDDYKTNTCCFKLCPIAYSLLDPRTGANMHTYVNIHVTQA